MLAPSSRTSRAPPQSPRLLARSTIPPAAITTTAATTPCSPRSPPSCRTSASSLSRLEASCSSSPEPPSPQMVRVISLVLPRLFPALPGGRYRLRLLATLAGRLGVADHAYPSQGGSLANTVSAPSYFSQYFLLQISNAEENGADVNGAIKTLYIDRDPLTFRDIALHLQGYHVSPRDGTHFVRLFADAQFYSCMFPVLHVSGERKGEGTRQDCGRRMLLLTRGKR